MLSDTPIVRPGWQRRTGPHGLPTLVSASIGGCFLAALVALSVSTSGDYVTRGPVGGDNPAPAIDALLHGHLAAFAAQQPLMGLVSIVLRAPFATLAMVWHGGDLATYRLGALACLLPAALLAGWLLAARQRGATGLIGRALVTVLILAGPLTRSALAAGHPEELLAAVLLVGSVLTALHGRDVWAAVLLGLAIGTKQWALVGVLPVLVALPRARRRAFFVTVVVAGLMSLPAPLADPGAFQTAARAVGGTHFANAIGIWWPVSSSDAATLGVHGSLVRVLPLQLSRANASISIFAVTSIVSVALCARLGRRRRIDPIALLALLALLRCVSDPVPLEYYYAPALAALGAWEVLSLRRLPIVTLLATAVVSATFGPGLHLPADVINLVSLAGAAVLVVTLARGAWFAPATEHEAGWA